MSSVRRVVALQASPEDALLCAQEPIHIPGAIQPHGAFLAVGARHGRITHVSANLAALLGIEAAEALGQPVESVLGVPASAVLLGADPGNPRAGAVHILPRPDGTALHLWGFRAGAHLCVDIETLREAHDLGSRGRAQAVRASLEAAGSQAELCERAVRGVKALSGYDRVMAYRFDEDGHGEVIAEAREVTMPPYLGLHFPASDIPAQARMLFLRQRIGAVANSSYEPVPLLADGTLHDGSPLDLTYSGLRSVSPVHREYMRNMKTAASLTVALVRGGALWGMLVCHNATPRIAGPELRATTDMFGQIVSLLLGNLLDAETAARRAAGRAVLAGLAQRMAGPLALPEALADAALPGLTGAAGAAIRAGGRLILLGQTPPEEAVVQTLAVLQAKAGGDLLAVEDLGLRHPELAASARAGSGALLLPLTPGTDDAILWVRPERARTVTWGGDPAAHAIRDPVTARLAPRASFAAWEETVSGHAAPWAAADLALARELRELVAAELARRARRELAALRDELAGGGQAATERSYRGLLEAAPDAMIAVSETGVILLANLRAAQQFGYPHGELLGREVSEILPKGLAGGRPGAALDDAIQDPAGLTLEVTGRRRDGGEFPAEITLGGMRSEAGRLTVAAIRNISVRKNAETHLQRMETRYRNLLEASPDVMVMINAQEEIVLVNRQAVTQFGYSGHQLIGQNVRGIIREGLLDERPEAGAGSAAPERRTLERTGLRRDGGEFPVEITIGPLAGDNAGLLTAAIRDISVRKEAEAALRRKVEELNRSNMELDQFASIASHDLQEPLRMVASYTQLLARRYKGKLDDDADMFINYAVDGATRMRQLIQDMLAYSRVGAKGLQLTATRSEAALEAALVSLRGAIRDSGAAVMHDPLPEVLADARQLTQLFQNLVGNAIKYHGSDSPVVHISAARIIGGRWEFSVRDNGLGIDPQYYQRIFGMFQRLHGREDFEGTGIGLAICKKIVEGHGGVISVDSKLGAGSVFRFTMAGVGEGP